MQETTSTAQDADYRRGVVLGLTMGEVMLLLVFALLLMFSVPLIIQANQAEDNQELERENELIRTALAEVQSGTLSLKENISKLQQAASGKSIEDLTKEYVLMTELLETVSDTLGIDVTAYEPAQLEKVLREMEADAQKGRLRDLTREDLVSRLTERELELRQVQKQLANTQGQLENLKGRISRGGRGVEAVPCWSTPEGKPEYIFDVALTTNGLIVRDRKLPHREDEQSELPLDDTIYGREIAPTLFLAATKPLFDWSVEHDCRFFVREFDRTGDAEKTVYKKRVRVLGDRFYRYEERNERF